MSRLRENYQKTVIPALKEKFGYKNVMAIPRIEKIVINVGAGVAIEKDHDSALSYLESKIKELEVAFQETNSQRQQIAANLEQGKQQMQQIMQQSQSPPQSK